MKSKEEILQAATEAGAVFGVEEKFFFLGAEWALSYADQSVEAALKKEWIRVADRTPENRTWVLVMCRLELFLANYKHGIFETEKPEILHGVTHWQPLPLPPSPTI